MIELARDIREVAGSMRTGYARTSPESPTLAGLGAKATAVSVLAGVTKLAYNRFSENGHDKSALLPAVGLGAGTLVGAVVLRGEIRDFADAVRRA